MKNPKPSWCNKSMLVNIILLQQHRPSTLFLYKRTVTLSTADNKWKVFETDEKRKSGGFLLLESVFVSTPLSGNTTVPSWEWLEWVKLRVHRQYRNHFQRSYFTGLFVRLLHSLCALKAVFLWKWACSAEIPAETCYF